MKALVVEKEHRGQTYLLQAPLLVFDFFLEPLANTVIGPRVSKLVEAYFEDIPKDALCMVRRNGPWKKLGKGQITRDLNKLRDAKTEQFIDMQYRGETDDHGGAPTDYGLHVEIWGKNEEFGDHDKVPYVSCWFPASQVDDSDAVAERFERYAAMVPAEAGGAGLRVSMRKSDYAETWWNKYELDERRRTRYLGSEVHPWREWSAGRAAGAMWLTYLGKKLAAKLGGLAGIEKKVAPAIVTDVDQGHGVCIRASRRPGLGAIPDPTDLGLLPRVARALEPLMLKKPNAREDPTVHYKRLYAIPDGPYENAAVPKKKKK